MIGGVGILHVSLAQFAMLEPARPEASEASGFPVFALTLVIGIAVIPWVWRAISRAAPE